MRVGWPARIGDQNARENRERFTENENRKMTSHRSTKPGIEALAGLFGEGR